MIRKPRVVTFRMDQATWEFMRELVPYTKYRKASSFIRGRGGGDVGRKFEFVGNLDRSPMAGASPSDLWRPCVRRDERRDG